MRRWELTTWKFALDIFWLPLNELLEESYIMSSKFGKIYHSIYFSFQYFNFVHFQLFYWVKPALTDLFVSWYSVAKWFAPVVLLLLRMVQRGETQDWKVWCMRPKERCYFSINFCSIEFVSCFHESRYHQLIFITTLMALTCYIKIDLT